MSVKTLTLPTGKTFKFGRKIPVAKFPVLKMSNYKGTAPAAPPPAADYATSAASVLSQMYQNDNLGDCVVAGVAHTVGVFTASNPPPYIFADNDVIKIYSTVCGYVPGKPDTDQGCDIQQVLKYWETSGAPSGSHKIYGILAVDPSNIVECQQAIWLFENLIFGVCLPDKWVNPVPHASGFVWDVAGNIDPNNGHCFPAFGYNGDNFTISTWGMTGTMTAAAITKYAASSVHGELYTVISQDILNNATKLAPNGLDWNTLLADFQSLGGTVINPPAPNTQPIPVPNTAPIPHPPPVPPVPTNLIPGTPNWLAENLVPGAFEEFVAALQRVKRERNPQVGSPAWLMSHMSPVTYNTFVKAMMHNAQIWAEWPYEEV